MNVKQRFASSTLVERPVWPHGRAGETGFPSLFMASGYATRMLVEISAAEPARLDELPTAHERDFSHVQTVLRKLIGQGLVADTKTLAHTTAICSRSIVSKSVSSTFTPSYELLARQTKSP